MTNEYASLEAAERDIERSMGPAPGEWNEPGDFDGWFGVVGGVLDTSSWHSFGHFWSMSQLAGKDIPPQKVSGLVGLITDGFWQLDAECNNRPAFITEAQLKQDSLTQFLSDAKIDNPAHQSIYGHILRLHKASPDEAKSLAKAELERERGVEEYHRGRMEKAKSRGIFRDYGPVKKQLALAVQSGEQRPADGVIRQLPEELQYVIRTLESSRTGTGLRQQQAIMSRQIDYREDQSAIDIANRAQIQRSSRRRSREESDE